MRPDFSLIWGADNAPFTPIEASDYTAGWVFRTGAPPRRVNFDYFQNLSDQRTAWLGEQMLLAVGHEWQDDVSYDAYAIVRSPVNGQLYRSLVGGNLNNEPSVSGAQWELGLGNEVPENLLTSGIAGSFSNLKASAAGTSALVTVTADSLCLKNSADEQVVLNAVSVTPSLSASGANGLDVGTSSANSWYSVWVIWNGTTTAGLLSLADGITTQPTLPSGYTHKARVGWVRSDSNASNKFPLGFVQLGRQAEYKIAAGTNLTLLPVIASGALGSIGVTLVSAAVGAFVPPTASRIRGRLFNGGGITSSHISPSSIATVPGNSGINASVGSAGAASIVIGFDFALETTNLWYAGTAAACEARASGWEDNL